MQSFVSRLFTAALAAVALCAGGAALAQSQLATSAVNRRRARRRQGAKSVANFLEYVKAGHYDGTIFHRCDRKLHDPGRRMTTEMKESRCARRSRREPNGLTKPTRTARDGAHARSEFGDGAFFINVRTRLPQPAQARDGNGYASSARSSRRTSRQDPRHAHGAGDVPLRRW